MFYDIKCFIIIWFSTSFNMAKKIAKKNNKKAPVKSAQVGRTVMTVKIPFSSTGLLHKANNIPNGVYGTYPGAF